MNKYIQDALFMYTEKYNQLYNWRQNQLFEYAGNCTRGKLE